MLDFPSIPAGNSQRNHRCASGQEDGFMLLAVLFMLILVLLSLAVAAPKVAISLRRDKEIETVHRGMQYARAIRLYYRKYGRYPSSIDQLMNTDDVRFLRKRYVDPMTGKNDWRIIHFGESQLMASGINGTPAGQMGNTSGMSPIGGGQSNGGFGSPSSGFSNSGIGSGLGSSNSSFGGNSGFGSSGLGTNSGTGTAGMGGSPFGGTDSGSTGTTGTGSTAFGTSGGSFGNAPIVGVGLPIDKASIKIYKKQTHYNTWEFVYDPSLDLGGIMGQNGTGGVTQPGMTNNLNNNGMGGSGFGNSGFGNSGFGNSGTGGISSPGSSGTDNGFGFSNSNGTNGSQGSPTTPTNNSPQ